MSRNEEFKGGSDDHNAEVHFLPAEKFVKRFIPGEYHSNWQGVSRNWDFKKGQSVNELADDIRENGVHEPVVVHADGMYRGIVVEGHHRVLAARKAGAEIPYHLVNDPYYENQVERARDARGRGGPI